MLCRSAARVIYYYHLCRRRLWVKEQRTRAQVSQEREDAKKQKSPPPLHTQPKMRRLRSLHSSPSPWGQKHKHAVHGLLQLSKADSVFLAIYERFQAKVINV
jgi:hypothetical protein